jgi:hypothetical protein
MPKNSQALRDRIHAAVNVELEKWMEETGEDPFTVQDVSTPKDAEEGRANFQMTINDPAMIAQIYEARINEALKRATDVMVDGSHHKTWVVDQMIRALLGTPEAYDAWVRAFNAEAGPEYDDWDEGIAP